METWFGLWFGRYDGLTTHVHCTLNPHATIPHQPNTQANIPSYHQAAGGKNLSFEMPEVEVSLWESRNYFPQHPTSTN